MESLRTSILLFSSTSLYEPELAREKDVDNLYCDTLLTGKGAVYIKNNQYKVAQRLHFSIYYPFLTRLSHIVVISFLHFPQSHFSILIQQISNL